MTRKELARNLAQSLTLGAWSREFIRSTLSRRFPRPLQKLGEVIAADLIASLPSAYSPSIRVVADHLLQTMQFEKAYRFCTRYNIWPDPDLTSPLMSPIKVFSELNIPHIVTLNDLSDWLFLPIDRLEYLADRHSRHEEHGDAAVNHYHYILQAKKSGSMRIIEAPKRNLKSVQRQILHGILDKVPTHASAFGFVKGRTCLEAANRHVGEQIVICFDLKNFFPSLGSARVLGLFRCLGYPQEVARVLTAFCTTTTPSRVTNHVGFAERQQYRIPHLPQGSPASPALSNLAVFKLDRRLSALARRFNANYSRYADDLCFSGDADIAAKLLRAVPAIVEDEGFHLNSSKTRIMSRTSRQVVTGIVVNEHLNVDRRIFDELKAIIHNCGKAENFLLNDAMLRASLLGSIDWVETVNPHRGQKLRGCCPRRSPKGYVFSFATPDGRSL